MSIKPFILAALSFLLSLSLQAEERPQINQEDIRLVFKDAIRDAKKGSDNGSGFSKFRAQMRALTEDIIEDTPAYEEYRLAVFNTVRGYMIASDELHQLNEAQVSRLGYLLLSSIDMKHRNTVSEMGAKLIQAGGPQVAESMLMGFQDSWIYDQFDTSTPQRIKSLIDLNFFNKAPVFFATWEPYVWGSNYILNEYNQNPVVIPNEDLMLRLNSLLPSSFARGLEFLDFLLIRHDELKNKIEEQQEYTDVDLYQMNGDEYEALEFAEDQWRTLNLFFSRSQPIVNALTQQLSNRHLANMQTDIQYMLNRFKDRMRSEDRFLDELEPEFRENFRSAEQQTRQVLENLGVCSDLLKNPSEADGKAPGY